MVGSAVNKALKKKPNYHVKTAERSELNLFNSLDTTNFLEGEKVEEIIVCAAKVGGIHANSENPFEFLTDNLRIQQNLLLAAKDIGISKITFLGSSCVYPKLCSQPIKEEYLLSGPLEVTNEAYALAKITGLKACEYLNQQFGFDCRSLMPTNLYGPNDNFDKLNSHVMAALIRKVLEAKNNKSNSIEVWGTGKPLREFMHVDDLAEALIFIHEFKKKDFFNIVGRSGLINVGSGDEISIYNLALMISDIANFKGSVNLNTRFPDGTPRKLLDLTKLKSMGWKRSIGLKEGIKDAISWYENSTYCK